MVSKQEIGLREAREASGLSLREASKQLKISHAYLSGLELGHKRLNQERTVELRALYGLNEKTMLVQPLPQDGQEFLSWLRNQIKWWDSRFVLPTLPGVARSISQLFVSPAFVDHDRGPLTQVELLHGFFSDPDNRALLIQGDIGTGKSFLMRMLTLDTDILCPPHKNGQKRVPLLVSLGEYQLRPGSFVGSLVAYYRTHGYDGSVVQLESFLRGTLERGVGLLLFDGLDEISDQSKRVEMLARLQQHFENEIRSSGNRLCISGRKDSFAEHDRHYQGFRLIEIEKWDGTQMRDACLGWAFDDAEQETTFFHLLQADDTLYELAKWPLLFHLLTTLYSSAGIRPFQGHAPFCDACCQVLESTWDSARRALQGTVGGSDPLQQHPWLKWRQFLIFFMRRCLQQALDRKEDLPETFTSAELREAWNGFLQEKGLDPQSLEFTRLEDVIAGRNRIGPIVLQREISHAGDHPVFVDKLKFLEPIFCRYYYAKALIDMGDRCDAFAALFLRSGRWQEILPLAVQELARSERSSDNRLGDQLIGKLLRYDDTLRLEGRFGIGKFGLLGATSAVVAYHPAVYWETVFKPFLDVYMGSPFEFDALAAHRVFGEHAASSQLRQHLLELYERAASLSHRSRHAMSEQKWRILEALGKLGVKIDEIVEVLVEHMRSVLGDKDSLGTADAILMRRVALCVRQVGRAFVLEEKPGPVRVKERSQRLERIQAALQKFLDFAVEDYEKAVNNPAQNSVNFWDTLASILATQEHLQYRKELARGVNRIMDAVSRNLEASLDRYRHRSNFIQFLKAGLNYAHLLEDKVSRTLQEKLEIVLSHAQSQERRELEYALRTFTQCRTEAREAWEGGLETALGLEKGKRNELIALISAQARKPVPDHIELGHAIYLLTLWVEKAPCETEQVIELARIVLNALKTELAIEEEMREAVRVYTTPFRNYCLPLYDHLYNLAAVLARKLPVVSQ